MTRNWILGLVVALVALLPTGLAWGQQSSSNNPSQRNNQRYDDSDARFRDVSADDDQDPSSSQNEQNSGRQNRSDQQGASGQQNPSGQSDISGARTFIRQNDRDNDGYLSRSEIPTGYRDNFNRIDSNGDGYLSARELANHAQRISRSGGGPAETMYVWIVGANQGNPSLSDLQHAYEMLQKIDQDNDGYITRSELNQQQQKVAAHWINHLFTRLDQNSDDEISRDEARNSNLAQRFGELDTNGDGYLTRSELRQDVQRDLAGESSLSEAPSSDRRR